MSSDRHLGPGGEGPIPFTSMDAFARRSGLGLGGFDRLRRLMRAMDAEYLRHRATQRSEADSKNRDKVVSKRKRS